MNFFFIYFYEFPAMRILIASIRSLVYKPLISRQYCSYQINDVAWQARSSASGAVCTNICSGFGWCGVWTVGCYLFIVSFTTSYRHWFFDQEKTSNTNLLVLVYLVWFFHEEDETGGLAPPPWFLYRSLTHFRTTVPQPGV